MTISISNLVVSSSSPQGSLVGKLEVVAADGQAIDCNYSLSGNGSAFFALSEDRLVTAWKTVAPAGIYSIRIRALGIAERLSASASFHVSVVDGPSPPAEPIPPQGAGPHFILGATGQIAVAPPAQLHAAGNDIGRLRELLPLVRRAAGDLAAALNPNQFTVLSRNLADYRSAIAGDASELAWGVVFGLGVRLANASDAAQRQIEDRLLSALEDPAQEALQSLNVLHGALIMATAEGRELEEQADRLQMTRDEEAAFRADAMTIAAELHRSAEMIEPEAHKIVSEAVEIIGEGRHAERGTVFGIVTIKHVTIVLVSAGTLAAFVPVGLALGGPIGAVVGGGAAWVGYKGLEKSNSYKAATTALGAWFNRLHELEQGAALQRLALLAPFRQFVVKNEQPLRRIATNTRMRWMLPYIDFIAPKEGASILASPFSDAVELSFDPADPHCVEQVPVYLYGQTEPAWMATSIRARVSVKAGAPLQKVIAQITKIEKLTGDGRWQDLRFPFIQVLWTDTGDILTDIPAKSSKYANLIHIDHPDNKITISQGPTVSSALAELIEPGKKYRFTLSIQAGEVHPTVQIEIDWKGSWDTIQVRSI